MATHHENLNVLACIDGSNVTTSVCDYAAWYGNQLDMPVQLLHVIDVPRSYRHDLSGAIGMDSRMHLLNELTELDEKHSRIANQHGDALLQDAKSHILKQYPESDEKVHTYLRRSKLLPAIEHLIKDTHVVILGRRGQDHQNDRMNIGSQIESVVRAIHRPIMVCSDDFETPTSFMLAYDNSPTANKAVQILCDSPIAQKLEGHIVMVDNQNFENRTALYKAQKKMSDAGIDVTAHEVDSDKYASGDVVDALTKYRIEHNISMFVIGAYGQPKWRQFFVGSTTTKLLTKTTAPVILLR